MATESLLVTGSVTSVVHVWQLPTVKDKNKNMQLVKVSRGRCHASLGLFTAHAHLQQGPDSSLLFYRFH